VRDSTARDALVRALIARVGRFTVSPDREAALAPETLGLPAEALAASRAALDAAPPDPAPFRVKPPADPGLLLRLRFEHTGDLTDVHEAIRLLREAEVRAAPGHPDGPSVLSGLGMALRLRHERTGDRADLDEAVRREREAAAVTPRRGTPCGCSARRAARTARTAAGAAGRGDVTTGAGTASAADAKRRERPGALTAGADGASRARCPQTATRTPIRYRRSREGRRLLP
jgi:hypothetical protein